MALDLSRDWELIDDLRAVSYYPRTGPGTYSSAVPVPKAFRVAPSRDDIAAAELQTSAEAAVWHVWKYHLGATVPKTGDRLTDDQSVSWTVKRVQRMDEGERFRLTCVREV